MRILESVGALRAYREETRGNLGFVPTMGALHQGHQCLMKRARESCEHVVVSVFVNPTQFGPGEDLQSYPRTPEQDRRLCVQAGVDALWYPQVHELYPPGHETYVELVGLGSRFEGESRPGHFRGVATVVTKLLNAVKPSQLFLGEKDLQQLVLLRRMIEELLLDIEVVGVPTARDDHGLALSSRNQRLTEEQRLKASVVYKGLREIQMQWENGEARAESLKRLFERALQGVEGAELERFDLFDETLSRRFEKAERVGAGFCSVAVSYGGVRLIDNIQLCS